MFERFCDIKENDIFNIFLTQSSFIMAKKIELRRDKNSIESNAINLSNNKLFFVDANTIVKTNRS